MDEDRFATRFVGADAWDRLPADQQRMIGAIALELVVAWNGQDAYDDGRHTRPFGAGEPLLLDMLHAHVDAAIPDVIAAELLPVPSLLGPVCRSCGCSEHDACLTEAAPCAWAEPGLCTACAVPGNAP